MEENNSSKFIKREEIKFWIAIIGIAVSGAVCFTKLQGDVSAMYDKEVALRSDYEKAIIRIDKNIEAIKDNQETNTINITEIKKDIEYIKQNIR